jgi:hypothetical protein
MGFLVAPVALSFFLFLNLSRFDLIAEKLEE